MLELIAPYTINVEHQKYLLMEEGQKEKLEYLDQLKFFVNYTGPGIFNLIALLKQFSDTVILLNTVEKKLGLQKAKADFVQLFNQATMVNRGAKGERKQLTV